MLPTPTVSQFRKAAASSPQQACVMIYRDATRTILWDDKLAHNGDHEVPLDQCLTLDHDQFEAIQQAIRTGQPVRHALTITRTSGNGYVFSATDGHAGSAGTARLYFDHHEYRAFATAVRNREFERRSTT
ncbi:MULTISPECIES: hypothetical protein [Nocardia]|uniref:hypothetical protein n=1 Tax=Nocardia TaxID=1817 RepID=UPI0024546423|nr:MULTISPECIES: hypothetical protein [Nocardia]